MPPVPAAADAQTLPMRSPGTTTVNTPFEESRHISSASYTSPDNAMSFRRSRTGSLGATSYAAVSAENSSILQTPNVEDAPELPTLSADRIQQGADVLLTLRDLPVYRKFIQQWFNLCDGTVVFQPVFRVWIDELWSEFGLILTEGHPDQMRALSERVWRNTRQPMEVHGTMTAREWAQSASGRNLRWESGGRHAVLGGTYCIKSE